MRRSDPDGLARNWLWRSLETLVPALYALAQEPGHSSGWRDDCLTAANALYRLTRPKTGGAER